MLLCLVSSACRATAATPPSALTETIAAYQASLAHSAPHAAYPLLSPELQASLPADHFETLWGDSKAERVLQQSQLALLPVAARLGAKAPVVVVPKLRLTLAGAGMPRSELQLSVDTDGRWRVTAPELAPVGASSPEAAIRDFLDAVEQRNLAAVLRLLSAATRQTVEDELHERAERLRAALTAPTPTAAPANSEPARKPATSSTTPSPPTRIEIVGDRARLQYDQRFYIELVREKDGWRIRDMN